MTRKIQARTLAELSFFIYLFYTTVSVNYGIYIQYLAPILMLFSASISLVLGFERWRYSRVFILIILTATTSIVIQAFVFGLGYYSDYVSVYYNWIIVAIMIFPLVQNDHFLKRLAIAILLIVITQLPFAYTSGQEISRMRFISGSTGFDNANDIAAWSGFSFIVLWNWLWKTNKVLPIIILFMMASVALYVVLNTISRSALLAIILALVITLVRISKKRRPLYVGLIVIMIFAFYLLPSLVGFVQNYQSRLTSDSGRLFLLESSWIKLQSLPIFGFGANRVNIMLPGSAISSPHNPIFLVGLSSGYLPLILFLLLWIRNIWCLVKNRFKRQPGLDIYVLFIYTVITSLLLNTLFASPWVVAIMLFIDQVQYSTTVPARVISSSRSLYKLDLQEQKEGHEADA